MRKISILLIGILIVLFMHGIAYGQWGSLTRDRFGMIGYVTVGVNVADPNDLNDTLKKNGFPTVGTLSASWGGGMHGVWKNRMVIGTSYHRLFSQKKRNGAYQTKLSNSLKMLDFGYLVFRGENMQIYPLIGVGMVSDKLTIYSVGDVSFGDIMTDPKRGVNLDRQGLLFDIGVQANRFVMIREKKQYLWGFRTGYRFVPAQRSWRMDGSEVEDGPLRGIEGPYFHFNFGVNALVSAIRGKGDKRK